MHRPFEAVGAIIVGLIVYSLVGALFHVLTGHPVSWTIALVGICAFIVGATVARNLWK